MGKLRAVRTSRWKLVHYIQAPEGFELFDLDNDPYEQTNLYHDPAFGAEVQRLRAELERLRTATGDDRSSDGTPTEPCEYEPAYRWAQ